MLTRKGMRGEGVVMGVIMRPGRYCIMRPKTWRSKDLVIIYP